MTAYDWITLVVIVFCIFLSAFFAGSETALTASSRASMHRLDKQGNRRAVLVNHLLNARERMIGALLFGNNAVNIAASALATGLLLDWFGEVGVVYATIVMTVAIVVFAEILPKTAAFNAPNRIALAVARPIDWTVRLLAPILVAVEWIVKKALRLFGVKLGQTESILSPHEELRGAVDLLHGTGGVETLDRDMLRGLLDLRDLTVSDVMIHRTEMVTVCADDPPEQVVKAVLESEVTRVPLWKDKPENIIGMLRIFCGRCRWPRAISARST
jgi:Mg2+/Co2+ transporter CorB